MTTKTKSKPTSAAEAAAEPLTQPAPVIVAYKGLDANFACRGHQFEVGRTYTVEGPICACSHGFHACENPLDVWTYYPMFGGDARPNRFALVELSGATDRHNDDSKIAAASITIKAELTVSSFITDAVKWIVDAGRKVIDETKGKGDDPSGNGARIGSSGYGARIGSSGNDARIGSSGNDARIGSSGYGARIGSSGNDAQIGSSGNDARIGSSGNDARIGASGANSVVASTGRWTRAKGAVGTWISLAEFDDDGKCVGFATGCIGKDGLEPDVWYIAEGGKLVNE